MCNKVILWAAFPSVLGGCFQLEFHIILSATEIIHDVSGMQMGLFFDFDFRRENREEGWEAVLESKVVGTKV